MTVQEIADEIDKHAIKGIFIKNPVNADSDLWLGNIERLEKTGVPIAAIQSSPLLVHGSPSTSPAAGYTDVA